VVITPDTELEIANIIKTCIKSAGYSTRQSVASVAWDERDRASKRILLLWVTLSSAFLMRVLLFLNSRKQDLKSSTAW
jgi:hypothetical protein